MSTATTRPTSTRWLLSLLLGAVLCTGLWAVGVPEMGWLGFLTAAFLGPVALRQGAPPRTEAGRAAPAGDWPPAGRFSVDPTSSRVGIAVRKWGWPVRGRFSVSDGQALVTDDPGSCRTTVSTAAASFATGNPTRDRHVRGPAFLDSASAAHLTFASTLVSRRPDGVWDVAGTLTVRGVAAPVSFVVDDWYVRDDGQVVAAVQGTVSRSALGVRGYRWLVGDRVRVDARIVLVPCR